MTRQLTPNRGSRGRRRASRDALATDDVDAIWRGEVDDADIVLTAAEHAELRSEHLRRRRRRSLVEVFGEPVGILSTDAGAIRHRRRGDGASHGAPLEQQRTAGCREEIQVTVLAHPVVAAEMIGDDGLFATARGLVVDMESERPAHKEVTWDARVKTTPWTRRAARVRLYGSPSSNVTVLTLTPRRSRRRGARLFLRSGLRSMFDVRDAIQRSLAS